MGVIFFKFIYFNRVKYNSWLNTHYSIELREVFRFITRFNFSGIVIWLLSCLIDMPGPVIDVRVWWDEITFLIKFGDGSIFDYALAKIRK